MRTVSPPLMRPAFPYADGFPSYAHLAFPYAARGKASYRGSPLYGVFFCSKPLEDPSRLHNLVKRLRQKHGTASSAKPVPIEAFLAEVKSWQADLPKDLSAGDLSQLLVLKSPKGVVVEEGRIYVPLSCPGMLLRLKDAAKHRIRLMAQTPAVQSSHVQCAARHWPVMQAIVSSESEENVTEIFEDLCWHCKDIANFDLKSQLVQVHADYAPGIAAARRAVFPTARLVGDYFHYKQALARTLPKKFGQSAKKAPGRKKPDPAVANVMTLSVMTRCLPTLHLADTIWQVIFGELPADVAKYLQRQFFAQGTVPYIQRVFKSVRAPAPSAKKLWVPSFWVGILGTSPGNGGGTNPLEARHASWEAELKSRTKDGNFHLHRHLNTNRC
ncbi:RPL15 [Symbiodinium sp. CCMP2592]|nr:RPL15 [Symbiodinium sp. CCMP2592]